MRMDSRGWVIVALMLPSGCVDRKQDAPDDGDQTSADTTVDPATATGDGATADPSTPTAPATSAQTSAQSSSATSGDDSSPSTTSSTTANSTTGFSSTAFSTTGGDDQGEGPQTGGQNVEYTARAIIGALDRVEIRKADYDGDLCMWVRIVRPSEAGVFPGVEAPTDWAVEQISINDVATSCEQENPAMFGGEQATGATGTITFGELGQFGWPCDLDIDVTAQFAGMLPDVPASADMNAVELVVEDAC